MKVVLLRPLPDKRRWSMDFYSRELEKSLRPFLGPDDELEIFPPENKSARWAAGAPGFLGKIHRWWQQYVLYGLAVRSLNADIYHITDHGYGNLIPFLKGKKTVVTFHDALLPRLEQKKIPVTWRPRSAIRAQDYSLAQISKAAYVITASSFSRQEFLDCCRFPAEKTMAVYLGLNPAFLKPVAEAAAALRKSWRLEKKDIVLLPGRSDPHKNIEGTLRIFAKAVHELRQKDCVLLKIGDPLTESQRALARELLIHDRVIEKDFLPGAQVPAVYQMSRAVVFLSWYEGFGLPILEAMASGVPILISNRGSLPEVSGGQALMTDPADIDASARGLVDLLTSVKFRSEFIDKGKAWVPRFTWEKTGRQVWEVYQSLL